MAFLLIAAPGADWAFTLGVVMRGDSVVTIAAFHVALGWSARAILGARPGAAVLLSRISGVGMVVIGALLLLERLVR